MRLITVVALALVLFLVVGCSAEVDETTLVYHEDDFNIVRVSPTVFRIDTDIPTKERVSRALAILSSKGQIHGISSFWLDTHGGKGSCIFVVVMGVE